MIMVFNFGLEICKMYLSDCRRLSKWQYLIKIDMHHVVFVQINKKKKKSRKILRNRVSVTTECCSF